jgi:hypothetical protein
MFEKKKPLDPIIEFFACCFFSSFIIKYRRGYMIDRGFSFFYLFFYLMTTFRYVHRLNFLQSKYHIGQS